MTTLEDKYKHMSAPTREDTTPRATPFNVIVHYEVRAGGKVRAWSYSQDDKRLTEQFALQSDAPDCVIVRVTETVIRRAHTR